MTFQPDQAAGPLLSSSSAGAEGGWSRLFLSSWPFTAGGPSRQEDCRWPTSPTPLLSTSRVVNTYGHFEDAPQSGSVDSETPPQPALSLEQHCFVPFGTMWTHLKALHNADTLCRPDSEAIRRTKEWIADQQQLHGFVHNLRQYDQSLHGLFRKDAEQWAAEHPKSQRHDHVM